MLTARVVGALALASILSALACGTSPSPFNSGDAGDGGGGDTGSEAASCAGGLTSCNGACVDTKTSATSCGGCGRTCATGESCCGGGSCSSDTSCALTLTDVQADHGYVGGGAYVTIHGKGFAAGLRATIGDGRAPVRVVDATTALLLTPPAPFGVYDVHVRLGTATATLPKAFTYRSETFSQQWVEISMSSPRGNFPAMTTLQDGRVLVVGGTSTSQPTSSLNTAELFDPVTHKMSVAANTMSVPRNTASAITLLDGRALVVGACNVQMGNGCLQPGDRAAADLFDPATNKFSPTKGPLNDATRVYMRLTLLPDGRVLVTSQGTNVAEVFDPSTDTFTTLAAKSANPAFGFPARLRDGRVVFVSDKVEVYDPDTDKVTAVAASVAHGSAAVYTLPDGLVISPGGADVVNGTVTPTDEVAILDVVKPEVKVLSQKLSSPRLKFASALLGDGTVMVAAGVAGNYPASYGCQSNTFPTTKAVDVVDGTAGTVAPFPALNDANMELVAATLLDGSILIGGGAPCGGAGAYPYVYFLQSVPPPN